MSDITALFLILLSHTFFLHNEAALVVSAPTPQKTQLGENFVLPCTFKVDNPTFNLKFLAILWYFNGKEIARFDNKGTSFQPRMFMNEQDFAKGIANLEIKNVTTSNIGRYRCEVIYSPQKESKDVDLSADATPSVTIEKVDMEDKPSFALCSVTGFYPKDISVKILNDNTVMMDSELSEYHTNADGSYSVNMTWKIPPEVSPKRLSCSVRHPTLTQQKDLQLVYEGDDSNMTGVVVGCVVGVILVILVVFLVFYICKRKSGEKFSVSDIEGPVWIDGEKITLSCKAYNCTGDDHVTWVITSKDGSQYEASDTISGDKEEEQPLMSREYQVTTECDNQKSNKHLTTKLTFIPSISRHLGSFVTCRIFHQKKPVEQTYEVKTIYAKPRFVEPLRFTLSEKGDVEISAMLQRFYPQEIDVSWFSKKGQHEERMKSEETKISSGDTFNVESKCLFPGELFKNPSHKVIVKWKHQSMETSQSRELSVKDLPWHPKLQKIPIESIFQGDNIILQCRVSDYFPDVLAVKWFERKTDSQDLVEIFSSQKYNIPKSPSHRMENQTFSSTSVLSYNRSDLSDKGVEFTCRVEHPNLDTPLQSSILQYRDTEAPTFVLNNIQGPQTWYSGEKITLYCAASYCMKGTQVIWMVRAAGVTLCEILEDGEDVHRDSSSGYLAHRERTEVSDDKEDLQDVTSSLSFTPSISKHQNITIACKIICDEKVKEKTFQHKNLYAKPSVSSPIKLSLTGSGEVICSLDINGFYPSAIQIKWNDKETSEPNRTSQNSDGSYSVHSDHKLSGTFFNQSNSTVRVSWKHDSMEDWESRKLSVLDKEYPWKVNVRDIPVPNLLTGSTATLKCEISNVFPDVLRVTWLKKEKGGQELFPVISSDLYNISELRPEKQKDNTFTYKPCLTFKPSISTDEGAEFICRVEHPTLKESVMTSTGPLTIKDIKTVFLPQIPAEVTDSAPAVQPTDNTIKVPAPQVDGELNSVPRTQQKPSETDTAVIPRDKEILIVGEIGGPSRWSHGERITLYCPVSYCSEDTRVMWMVDKTDGGVEEISNTGGNLLSGYMIDKEIEESDKKGLFNMTSLLTFVPSVSKHLGVIITCKIPTNGQTENKKFQPKSINAKPQVQQPVKTSLCSDGNVLCSLILQNVYPKQIKITWKSGETPLKSTEEYKETNDKMYNIHSHCTVPGDLLQHPNFTLEVTWKHKSLDRPQSQVLTWRDLGQSWCPVVEEIPIPHVLINQQNTLQYNISRYFPNAVTVTWYRKEKGGQDFIPLSHSDGFHIPDIQSQRQSDHTYSCTARLQFKPSMRDVDSEIICRVSHPTLESPLERRSGPLQVQAKPITRKTPKISLGTGEVTIAQVLENFYPKNIQFEWKVWSGEQPAKKPQSNEIYKDNMNKTHSVTSTCRVPEDLLNNPNFRVRVTWRHESMDEEEHREISIRDKDFSWKPYMEMLVPPMKIGVEATIQCTVTRYFPDALTGTWLKKETPSGKVHPLSSDHIYRISNTSLDRHNDKTYGCRSRVTFSPSLERDQGVEYICRVDHPSLEQPIEKSTGALTLTGLEDQSIQNDPQNHHDVPSLESSHPLPQNVSDTMGDKHPPHVLASECHNAPPQDVYNRMGNQQHQDIPVPESHHPHPAHESNVMGHQPHPGVPEQECHNTPQQDEYNRMGNPYHPVISESQHSHPAQSNVMGNQPHLSASIQESQYPSLDVSNMRGYHQPPNILASESRHSPSQYVPYMSQEHSPGYNPLLQDVNNMTGHQPYQSVPQEYNHHSPPHMYITMGYQQDPNVSSSESHHPHLQNEPNMMGNQHHHMGSAQKSQYLQDDPMDYPHEDEENMDQS